MYISSKLNNQNMVKRVDVTYEVEALRIANIKAAKFGISRRKFLEYSVYLALHNMLEPTPINMDQFINEGLYEKYTN